MPFIQQSPRIPAVAGQLLVAFCGSSHHNRPGFTARLAGHGMSARRGVPPDARRFPMLHLTPIRLRFALLIALLAGPGLVLLHDQDQKPDPKTPLAWTLDEAMAQLELHP